MRGPWRFNKQEEAFERIEIEETVDPSIMAQRLNSMEADLEDLRLTQSEAAYLREQSIRFHGALCRIMKAVNNGEIPGSGNGFAALVHFIEGAISKTPGNLDNVTTKERWGVDI